MFYTSDIESFNIELPSLITGDGMFRHCIYLSEFNTVSIPNLQTADYMFGNCIVLPSIVLDVPKLKNVQDMFTMCYALESFSGNLSNVERGFNMFSECNNLTTVSMTLNSLTDSSLFGNWFKNCTKLERVDITTSMSDTSIFTKSNFGMASSVKLFINGVEV